MTDQDDMGHLIADWIEISEQNSWLKTSNVFNSFEKYQLSLIYFSSNYQESKIVKVRTIRPVGGRTHDEFSFNRTLKLSHLYFVPTDFFIPSRKIFFTVRIIQRREWFDTEAFEALFGQLGCTVSIDFPWLYQVTRFHETKKQIFRNLYLNNI